MEIWTEHESQPCFGVVKYGFENDSDPHYILARLGEGVEIRAQCQDWFYVSKVDDEDVGGIIPKSCVHVQGSSIYQRTDSCGDSPAWTEIIAETTEVLKEWHKISRQNFLTRHPFFLPICRKIMDLHSCRKEILSQNWTVEGLKHLRKRVAHIVDWGSNLLKLDMTVRDDQGSPLNVSGTSAVQLFRQHLKTSERLEKAQLMEGSAGTKISKHHCHSLLLICEKITWTVVDECEIRIFLYDAVNGRPFSEGGQVTLTANTSFSPFRFLFADLGKQERNQERIYLIFYIVRVGSMEYREETSKRDNTPFSQKSSCQRIRRPWGVAARDVTKLLNFEGPVTPTGTAEEATLIPFYSFGDSDSMKTLLIKIIDSQQVKDSDKGFLCAMSLIPGTPIEVQEEQPLLMRGNPTIVRKMGFPEVILPNDVRNDLYVTLVSGEFHKGSKFTDKNIEVTVTAHNDSGAIIHGIIYGGSGSIELSQYQSVVYSDEGKPRWEETFKVTLPMFLDQFSKAHLKFSFKYRSAKESKDISEKPFAMAYVRLRLEKGTALPDGEHKLAIFKVDSKAYRESDVHYLLLPPMLTGGHSAKRNCPGLAWSPKDLFGIRTTLCSTQFTQNDQLRELLQWSTSLKSIVHNQMDEIQLVNENTRTTLCQMLLNNLKKTLQSVTTVTGEEIVKFLPHVFNALFSILVESVESIMNELFSTNDTMAAATVQNQLVSDNCDRSVFDCLIYIFGLILDHKFQHFKSVLYHYIEEEFSATMAYTKLLKELINAVSNPIPDRVLKIMKSFEFFMKFIVRSFSISIKLREMDIDADEGAKEEAEFEQSIESLFAALGALLSIQEMTFVNAQKGCLKYIHVVIEPLSTVFSERRLSELLVELFMRVGRGRMTTPKLTAIMDIVKSPLFRKSDSRTTLLPVVADNIKQQLPGNDEDLKRRSQEHAKNRRRQKLEKVIGLEAIESHAIIPLSETSRHSDETHKCVELLSEVMDILFSKNIGPTEVDISYMVQILLCDVISSIGIIGDDDPMAANMVAILMALLRQMPKGLFTKFMFTIKRESAITELFKFINDALVVFKSLCSKCFFHNTWLEMIMLQNSVLLGALEQFAGTIRFEFLEPFEFIPFNNFFQCAVSFLVQEPLQIETFSLVKRTRILGQYGDMRLRTAGIIRIMWKSLAERQIQFVPSMVGTFLDMAMVQEPTVRRIAIRIFFEMMRSDFVKNGNFQRVEDELINRLVESIETGHGDPAFRNNFYENMVASCSEKEIVGFKESALRMVETVAKLLDILLEYREVIDEADSGNRMSCTVNLLDFSMEVGRKELYLRYLYKLHDLHIMSHNYTEAAFTLKLLSRQLDWTEDEVPHYLRSPKYPHLTTQVELKETLYKDIINYFDDENAKSWECAIEVCDELRQLYAEELFSYSQLPELLLRMSNLYEKILKGIRFEPGYFRVAFFGRGFPTFLQDKVFVYRGRRSERLNDFEIRMLERFPHAELLRSLNWPTNEQRNSVCQLLQICNLEPVMDKDSNNKRISGMKYAEESIQRYYRSNDVNKFVYSRPYHKEPKDPKNEFASLWLDRHTLWTASSFPGNMSWFPVNRESSTQVKPILFGIETLREANVNLRNLILTHCKNPQEDLGPLSMKLNGVLDAAVMGGVSNYEKAFFCHEYLEREPEDSGLILTMKQLIVAQVPLLAECLRIHRDKAPEVQKPLQQKLEEKYTEFLTHLEDTYGDLNVNVKSMKDEGLQRDMERVQKKRLALTRKDDKTRPQVITRNSDGLRATALTRSKSSFSSTLSVYSAFSHSKNPTAKSLVAIHRPGITNRRSTQGSFDEAMGIPAGNMRGHLFHMGCSMNKLSSISGEDHETNTSHNTSTSSIHSQLNPRLSVTLDYRKSGNWTTNGNGDARSSGISISSNTETSSRNSMESHDLDEDLPPIVSPPPLPPKHHREALHHLFEDLGAIPSSPGPPPAIPPKKPPLKNDNS